mgnify:CR=1 FL=1
MADDALDATDRAIINGLQGGFPVCERPYAEAAARLGLDEATLLARLRRLLDAGVLTRFGPQYRPEALGGTTCLAAMAVPPEHFDAVAEIVNGFTAVAHNYARDHALNMWFVVATADAGAADAALADIQRATGLDVLAFPKEAEYCLDLKLPV